MTTPVSASVQRPRRVPLQVWQWSLALIALYLLNEALPALGSHAKLVWGLP